LTIKFKNKKLKYFLFLFLFVLFIGTISITVAMGNSGVPTNVTGISGSGQIDFSVLDTLVGAIIALVVVAGVFLLVGFFMIKYNIVTFTKDKVNVGCNPEALELQTCQEHSGFTTTITSLVEECRSIWLEIKEVNKRQISLRERLPSDYVSKSDLIDLKDRLKSIDNKLDRYLELYISTNK